MTPYHCSFENETRTKPSKLPKVFFPQGRMAAAKGLGGNSCKNKLGCANYKERWEFPVIPCLERYNCCNAGCFYTTFAGSSILCSLVEISICFTKKWPLKASSKFSAPMHCTQIRPGKRGCWVTTNHERLR